MRQNIIIRVTNFFNLFFIHLGYLEANSIKQELIP